MDEAERCFDALITLKLLLPREVGSTCKTKSCGVNPLFAYMSTDAAAEEAFLETNQLPADLQLHFSIRKGIQLRRMAESNSKRVESTISLKKYNKSEKRMKIMMSFLKRLSSSSSFRLLRVLELEGFKGFKKRHVKNIF
ncbi:hypothetical protein PR202_ga22649 [Eleusine coracana subsp. coracana]|uniref:Uncharacterized protein n=1 Tax=Eleusine coracana subsp. coracana TaxID=191504 RepID=A0AAV5D3M0_ELECO|nr:hypothetical protein PR202_ga22649 [Eleusine coracana subsp. coracana]